MSALDAWLALGPAALLFGLIAALDTLTKWWWHE